MAFELIDNISYKGAKFLDNRKTVETTTVLLNWNFVTVPIPEGFKVYCLQTAKWYIYRSSNQRSAVTGFFVSEDEVLEANLQAVVSRLDVVEPAVALNTQNIAAARSDIETLQASMTQTQQSIVTINSQLSNINYDITALAANYREQQQIINALVGNGTACKGYFQNLASLQEAYPTSYDGDFAYVLPTDVQSDYLNIYRFNGSTQQWVLSGRTYNMTTPSIQGLLPTNNLPFVNASLYQSGLQVNHVTTYVEFEQFLDAENRTPPVLPVAMRKPGMVVAIRTSIEEDNWEVKQFRGTNVSTQWTNIDYWTNFPATSIYSVDAT